MTDSPIPMGPIVYLSAGTRAVSTLICRCMPAQAKTLRATTTYDLLPFKAIATNSLLPWPTTTLNARPPLWPGDTPGSPRLERCLRLPSF